MYGVNLYRTMESIFYFVHSSIVKREVLYNILNESGMSMKLVGLIKTCLNEACSNVCIGKICLMHFLFRMV